MSKIVVNRQKLVDKLRQIEPALGGTDLVEQFGFFQFLGSYITAMDGIMFIRTDYGEELGLDCSLPGKPLLDLLARLTEDTVTLEKRNRVVKGEKRLSMRVLTDKVEGEFALFDPGELADLPEVTAENCVVVADTGFLDGLSFARLCVSKDKSSVYSGINLQFDRIFATDRVRLARYIMEKPLFDKDSNISAVVPLKFATALCGLRSMIYGVRLISESLIGACLDDGTVIVSALLPYVYDDVSYVFDGGYEFVTVDFGEKISDMLDRHLTFAKNQKLNDKELLVELKSKEHETVCHFTTSIPELGNLSESLLLDVKLTETFSFRVNPVFLKHIVTQCTSFQYCPVQQVILFSTGNLSYLVKPK